MSFAVFAFPLVEVSQPGYGYIAGEAPGIVTLNNIPGVAVIDLLRRSNNEWLRREFSFDDGTYRFDRVALDDLYNIVARDPSDAWDDVIVGRVSPYGPPQVDNATLTFTVGNPASTQMIARYGAEPHTWAADVLPPGLSLSVSGMWAGTPTAAGTYAVTVTVVDAFGATGTRTYAAAVT